MIAVTCQLYILRYTRLRGCGKVDLFVMPKIMNGKNVVKIINF